MQCPVEHISLSLNRLFSVNRMSNMEQFAVTNILILIFAIPKSLQGSTIKRGFKANKQLQIGRLVHLFKDDMLSQIS